MEKKEQPSLVNIIRLYMKNGNDLFHVINDQNNRNIISGTAKDFLLGDNIRKRV